MKVGRARVYLGVFLWTMFACVCRVAAAPDEGLLAPLPKGAPADPESLDGAWCVRTATRTRYSLNGLWRCRPSFDDDPETGIPGEADGWGWARLPSGWQDPRQPFPATPHLAPRLAARPARLAQIRPDRAWYRRVFVVPDEMRGRRVSVAFDMVHSRVAVWVNGCLAGAAVFPCGEVDVTAHVRPGEDNTFDFDLTAYPFSRETLDYNEPSRATKKRATMRNKGLTGDVWLDATPATGRILSSYATADTSKMVVTFGVETTGFAPGEYGVRAVVTPVAGCAGTARTFTGRARLAPDGRLAFSAPWPDAACWDTHTPGNRYTCRVALLDAAGRACDEAVPFAFGFREIRLDGRNILLNGKPIHLRATLNGNTRWGAAYACRETCRAQCRHLLGYGFNFLVASNYRFNAGEVCSFDGMLDACDETGMLYSFTLPHIAEFDRALDKPDVAARYRAMCTALIRRVRNHPALLTYALNHNCTGYGHDQNPLQIGLKDEPEIPNPNRAQARRARQIVQALDPSRPAYHHESGNFDGFHTLNSYLNWAPVQERSDWMEDWHRRGVKPLIFVEWGLPHIASWSSNRGPGFIWADPMRQSIWLDEYAAMFYGDAAYRATPARADLLRREEALWEAGQPFMFGPLCADIRRQEENYLGVQALFAADNMRSFRGWGVTGVLPWDQDGFFVRTGGASRPNPDAWKGLKRPGLLPDAFPVAWPDPVHFRATPIGATLLRWMAFDCGWIAGDEGTSFTDKQHLYRPGETVRKTLMLVNDRRVEQTVRWTCRVRGEPVSAKSGAVTVAAGATARVPVSFVLPGAGDWTLEATFDFAGGVRQEDTFVLTAVSPAVRPPPVCLVDTKNMTAAHFDRLGIAYRRIAPSAAQAASAVLAVGRETLTKEMFETAILPAARAGGCVVVFEQNKETLEALGFRVVEYGLRTCFRRYRDASRAVPDDGLLRDWSGESTLIAPYSTRPDGAEKKRATWAGLRTSRVWRCRNRGAVATVLPEKPAVGDWRALVDGGFDLQAAPLLEWRTGKGCIVFCQMDVTARTRPDPVADDLTCALLVPPPPVSVPRPAFFLKGGEPLPDGLVAAVRAGATALCAGFSADEVKAVWPQARMTNVTDAVYRRMARIPPELNGLSHADWAWHGTMSFAAFADPCETGNQAIRVVRDGAGMFVFWQVPPWMIDATRRPYLRTSRRRADAAFARLKANLGLAEDVDRIRYADVPEIADDPFRYYRW